MPAPEEEDPDKLVFLSPEEEFQKKDREDQGGSPVLRRSNRKRKSTASTSDMTRNSATKKKKSSPEQAPSMPKVPRTPVGQADQQQQQQKDEGKQADFEKLLLAMEARLSSKMDVTNKAVAEAVSMAKRTNESLSELEGKVDGHEEAITTMRRTLEQTEKRLTESFQANMDGLVKSMVADKLKEAGFDQDLTVGDLSTCSRNITVQSRPLERNYARAAASASTITESSKVLSKTDRQEEKFCRCRRALRIWPLEGNRREDLDSYLTHKLRMDKDQVESLGEVVIQRVLDKRNK